MTKGKATGPQVSTPETSKSLPQETTTDFFFLKNLKVLSTRAAQEDKKTDPEDLASFQVLVSLREAEQHSVGVSSEVQ